MSHLKRQIFEYLFFAIVTVILGLFVCNFICWIKPEFKMGMNDNSYVFEITLFITGLLLKFILSFPFISNYIKKNGSYPSNLVLNEVSQVENVEETIPIPEVVEENK